MRKPLIAGNWKLNHTIKEALILVTDLKRELIDVTEVDIVVCPVFTAIDEVADSLMDTNIGIGGQDLYWDDSGAFTGRVSAPLLKDAGAKYVIIGHSECRQLFHETNETVNKKLKAALKHGLIPIVCVGEVLQERESNKTLDVLNAQCRESLVGLTPEQMKKTVIAYEPVWAIGTGRTATSQQAQEAQQFIRGLLTKLHSEEVAQSVRILYGGSIKPDNIAELLSQPDVDGGLVGGASLKADSFIQIVKNACGVKTG